MKAQGQIGAKIIRYGSIALALILYLVMLVTFTRSTYDLYSYGESWMNPPTIDDYVINISLIIASILGIFGVFLVWRNKKYGLIVCFISPIIIPIITFIADRHADAEDLFGPAIAYSIPIVLLFISTIKISLFNLVQIILCIALMIAGLVNIDSILGKGLFSVGGIWLLATIRMMWGGRNRSSIADFVTTLASVSDLATPKQITVVSKNSLLQDFVDVFLNGEVVGRVNNTNPCTFSITKQKNVVSLPGGAKSACFFEVTEMEGNGELHIKMGLADPVLVIGENSGLTVVNSK